MKLPTILAVDKSKENEVILNIEISPQLEAFAGHFPHDPILPGVVQIDWAVRFSSVYFGIKQSSVPSFQVKYRNIIRPNAPISLSLKLDPSKNQLIFSYRSGDDIMSSGQLKLGVAP